MEHQAPHGITTDLVKDLSWEALYEAQKMIAKSARRNNTGKSSVIIQTGRSRKQENYRPISLLNAFYKNIAAAVQRWFTEAAGARRRRPGGPAWGTHTQTPPQTNAFRRSLRRPHNTRRPPRQRPCASQMPLFGFRAHRTAPLARAPQRPRCACLCATASEARHDTVYITYER